LITVCKHCHYILEEFKEYPKQIVKIHYSEYARIVECEKLLLLYLIELNGSISQSLLFKKESELIKLLYELSIKK